MIKCVLFDMDGVLIDADKWHFNALNVALQYADIEPISWNEHLTIYKGIPTRDKLEILTERRGLNKDLWGTIATAKQEITVDIINKFCSPDAEKVAMLQLLRRRFKIGVCSNSKRETVELMLRKSGLLEYVDFSVSNEDIPNAKPAPDIYLKGLEIAGLSRSECIAVEDSDVGRAAVMAAGIRLCPVVGPQEVNYYRVMTAVHDAETPRVIIPAAGQGKRFSEVGYVHPKPLIDVEGRAMISWVLDNVKPLGKPVVILQDRHVELYCADKVVKHYSPGAEVVGINGLTEGAACTVLKAEQLIDNNSELIIANSDQFLDLDLGSFLEKMRSLNADGGILTFKSNEPKWSYAKLSDNGTVEEVAEKRVISEHATVGVYYFKTGASFVRGARKMILNNVRVNNEFYVCPVFNELIFEGARVHIMEISSDKMYGLGTPEDLDRFLARPRLQKETEIIVLDDTTDVAHYGEGTHAVPAGTPVITGPENRPS